MSAVSIQGSGFKKALWLITFGDLLTLLLCFFIAAISLKPKQVTVLSELTPQSNKGTLALSPTRVASTTHGTPIANKTLDRVLPTPPPKSWEIQLKEASFTGNSGALSEGGREMLKNRVFLAGYKVQQVEISSCEVRKGRWNKQAELTTVQRAIAVRGQLIDMGIAGELVKVRTVLRECSSAMSLSVTRHDG